MRSPGFTEDSETTAESIEAFPIEKLSGGTAVVAAVITRKFTQGATIEEISHDWGIDPHDAECVSVHPLILEALRYELIRLVWPDVNEQA